jgi:hypothetical protein
MFTYTHRGVKHRLGRLVVGPSVAVPVNILVAGARLRPGVARRNHRFFRRIIAIGEERFA